MVERIRPYGASRYKRRLKAIADRDKWRCWLCGQAVDPKGPYEHRPSVDHVKPHSEGGESAPENLRFAHQSCNAYRAGALVEPFAAPLADPLVAVLGDG